MRALKIPSGLTLIAFVLPLALLAVVPAVAQGTNGIQDPPARGPSQQGPIVIDDPLWYEFAFTGVGIPATGCPPPNGLACTPSSGGNSQFADAPPWTFTAGSAGVNLRVTDAFDTGDQFEVFDFGGSIGVTSAPVAGNNCGDDPVPCEADPNASSGTFFLGPGPHSIDFVPVQSVLGAGAAYFRVDSKDQCRMDIRRGRARRVPAGYRIEFKVDIVHNRQSTVQRPLYAELRMRDGSVVAASQITVLRLEPGDAITLRGGFNAPADLAPGSYVLALKLDAMNGFHERRRFIRLR